jgi:hypothetical protein
MTATTFEALTAWATVAIAVATIASIYVTYKAMKKQVESLANSVSADLALKLVHDFESPEKVALRGRVAQATLQNLTLSESDDLFDFFELIGFYVRRGQIDAETAHSFFFHWVNLYWNAGKSSIEKKREASVGIWKDFESLYKTVRQIEMDTDRFSRFINPSAELIKSGLEEECV